MILKQSIIIKILKENKSTSFASLYKRLKHSHPGIKKKKVRSTLIRMMRKEKIHFLSGGNRIILSRKYIDSDKSNPAKDFDFIIKKHELNSIFSENILQHAAQLSSGEVQITDDRTDFTYQNVITIDGEDAKDFDDAVYLEKKKNNYFLFVHIADVSHYVRENSQMDTEAYKRGTSIYLVDRVIPMLPTAISNGICSLRPNEKRNALSVEISFDENSDITGYQFYNSVIESKRRCTYNEIEKLINQSYEEAPEDMKSIYHMVMNMKELAMKLKDRRFENGGLNLETKELYIKTDDNSYPIDISITPRLISNQIIEEFMLIANVIASTYLSGEGDTIYRIHDKPEKEKMSSLNKDLRRHGFAGISDPDNVTPKDIQQVLESVKDNKQKQIIHMITLRAMKQAEYSTENRGHFGLAFNNYTHFTSPIRRYPDLIIHRLLKLRLGFKVNANKCLEKKYLDSACENSSKMERVATDAEREIIKRKSAHFMKDKTGNVYKGFITGIAAFGFFIEIEPYGIEGLCSLESLKYHYVFDEEYNELQCDEKNIIFTRAKQVTVKVVRVNTMKAFIDFELVDEDSYILSKKNKNGK